MKVPLLNFPEETVYIDGRYWHSVTFLPIKAIIPFMAFAAITSLPRRLLKRLYAMIKSVLPGFKIKPVGGPGTLRIKVRLYNGGYRKYFTYFVTEHGLVRSCNLQDLVSAFDSFQKFMEEISSVDNELTWEFVNDIDYITDIKTTRRYDNGVGYSVIYIVIARTLVLYISPGECEGEGFVMPPKARTGHVYCIHKVGLIV